MTIEAEGKFKKIRVIPLVKEYGLYRGRGEIIIDDQTIKIEGSEASCLTLNRNPY